MRPRGADARRDLAAALLAGLALYAAGAGLLDRTWPPALAARPAAAPLRFAFHSDETGMPGASAWDRDPRALWSPVLFALPSEAGFSPAWSARRKSPSPLLSERAPPVLLLDRNQAGAAPAGPADRTGGEIARLFARRWTALAALEEPFARWAPTSVAVEVAWPDGAPELTGGLPLAIEPPPGRDEKPWEAAASVFFDETGEPRGVFLEHSTAGRERNESLVRALRRLRAAPGRAAGHRVAVFLQRPPQTAARPTGAAP